MDEKGGGKKGLNHRGKVVLPAIRMGEREMDERESGHVCMQVIVHQNPKRPLHTIKERAKALCTDWTAYRALHINRQIIPTACTTKSTLLVKPKKDTNLSRGQRLKDTKEWKFSVEGGRA